MKTSTKPHTSNSHQLLIAQSIQENLSSDALQDMAEALRQDLQFSTHFVSQCEAELAQQCQIITQLETKLKTASESDYELLAMERDHAQQKKEILEKMLSRQRDKLAECQTRLIQYEQTRQQQQDLDQTPDNPGAENRFPEFLETITTFAPQRPWLKWTVALSIIAFLGIGAAPLFFHRQQPQASEVTADESYQPQAVAALGYIKPAGEVIEVSAPVFTEGAPRVEKLLVQQGDTVKAGQIVAVLDIRDRLQAALEEAQQKVKISQARLEQVKAGAKSGNIEAQNARYQHTEAELQGQIAAQQSTIANLDAQLQGERKAQQATIDRIKAELQNAQVECDRYKVLFEDGAVSAQERERVCLKLVMTQESLNEASAELSRIVRTLQSRISEAQANLQRTVVTLQKQIKEEQATLSALAEVRPVDLQIAQAELSSAQAAVKKAKVDLEQAYVRVPNDGQILKVLTWPGEMVNNQGIVQLGQTQQMYVKAEVYETDISQVKLGQPATISSDQVINNLQGTVEDIGLQIDKQKVMGLDPSDNTDGRVVEVSIRLNPQDSQKVAKLTNLQVNVVIDTSNSQSDDQDL